MINAQTLALDSLSSDPHLPLFWRLGKLNTGQPLLWPITYQQAMVVQCTPKTHDISYRFLENILLSLWQQTQGQYIHISLYESSLKTACVYTSQLPSSVLSVFYHKKMFKEQLDNLRLLAQQRKTLLQATNMQTWYSYLQEYPQAEPLHIVVLTQLWPDMELLTDLSDLCRYGTQLGILPILVVSERWFPENSQDEWQQALQQVLVECYRQALIIELKQQNYVQIKHRKLQDIADLYAFFKPKIDKYSEVVYKSHLGQSL